jgi:hypothetical protein
MNNSLIEHPAVQFGAWLKSKRRASGVVARIFAGRIDLSPAEYAEVESGVNIIRWIKSKQASLISIMLKLDSDGEAELNNKLSLAREGASLGFSDVFSKDQLAPARCSTDGNEQIDEEKRQAIIEAVFKPLD